MQRTTNKTGRWVYGVDYNIGLPAYSERTFSCPGDAIRAAVKECGLSTCTFRLVVGRLEHPKPPTIQGPSLLIHLFKERYESAEAVLYQPGAEAIRWSDTLRMEALEKHLNEVLGSWFAEPDHNLGWYEVVDEYEVANEDLLEAVNELQGARA